MDTSPPNPTQFALLDALAVLGRAEAGDLSALLQHPLTAQDEGELGTHAQAGEDSQPGYWQLADGEARLQRLADDDPATYIALHQRTLAFLGEQLLFALPAGAVRTRLELCFATVFERLANFLLPHAPQVLADLMENVRDVPLTMPVGIQLRRFFDGVTLGRLEEYDAALALFDALLEDAELIPRIRGRTLNSRAIYCRIVGRLQESIAGYQAALQIWHQLDDLFSEGKTLLNLGVIYYQLQEYDAATDALLTAQRCFTLTGSSQLLASVHNELGLVYRDQGRWAEAMTHLTLYAERRRAEGAQDALGGALNNIGEVWLLQGELLRAEQAFHEALQAMTSRVYAVDTHANLGLIYEIKGDLEQAYRAYQAALQLAVEINRRDIVAEIHYRLGLVLQARGDGEAAVAQWQAAVQIIETIRGPLHEESFRIRFSGRWQQVYEALVLYWINTGDAGQAFHWAERARARAFAELLARHHEAAGASPTACPAPPCAAREPARPAVGRAGGATLRDPSGPGGSPATMAGTATVVESIEVAQLQAEMRAGTLLLCYFTTGLRDSAAPYLRTLANYAAMRATLLPPAHTLLFAITAGEINGYLLPLDPNHLLSPQARANDLSRMLTSHARRHLYQMLLPQTLDLTGIQWLVIAPHGPLHQVSFAALLDSAGEPLLTRTGPRLLIVPSASIWQRYQREESRARRSGNQAHGSRCLAIGFQGEDKRRLLRHTEAEARFVAAITQGDAITGAMRKLPALAALASEVSWLHFACHGWFDPDVPLASYLETGEGERLTAAEVLATWQLQTDLVVLSGCQTAVNRILRGDEPMGLVRGFLAAGAHHVIASQWPIADLPTFLLMRHLYTQMVATPDIHPAAALHDAQLYLRQLSRPVVLALAAEIGLALDEATNGEIPPGELPFAAPAYWAGLVLVAG